MAAVTAPSINTSEQPQHTDFTDAFTDTHHGPTASPAGDMSGDHSPESGNHSPEPALELIRTELQSLKSLSRTGELLQRLQSETDALEEQVRLEDDGFPPRVSSALRDAENVSQKSQEILRREEQVYTQLSQHLGSSRSSLQTFSEAFLTVDVIERHMKYLLCLQHIQELSTSRSSGSPPFTSSLTSSSLCLQHIQELSSSVQQCLMTNSVEEAVSSLDKMAAVFVRLQESRCLHLQDFLLQTLTFWHKILKDRLTSELEEVLSSLQWPALSSPAPLLAPPPAELCVQLETLVSQLLSLQNSDNLITQSSPGRQQEAGALAPPLCLPVQILLQPLAKRFRFHFYGNRQTNCLSKPEWYLTQVLVWITHNSAFMDDRIQPVLDRAGAGVSAKVELCRGLLSLVQRKVQSEAPRLLYEDALFCHLLEELLHFERELRLQQLLPPSVPAVLHLLLEPSLLHKWLSLERKMALEKVDSMMSSEGAWTSQYKDISDVDELKAPDCAETFMTLLQVITDRYSSLPCPSSQLKFLDLQRELVDDFRIRLTQVMKEESRAPLGARYCSILNAVNYIITILCDWEDNVFFLQLQQAAVSLGADSVVGPLGATELGRLASLEGSLFEELLRLLQRLKSDMTGRLLDAVMRELGDKARPYCQDRWLSMVSPQEQSHMSLSSSACPLMLTVRDRLLQLHLLLSLPLFQATWQGLAERLDCLLYQELILSNHFSDAGAAQLHFDMNRNLFPLFAHYCKRPDNYLKHVKEACLVLSLPVGSALLLRTLLRDGDLSSEPSPQAALNEMGVYCLSPSDVLLLLGLRAALPAN